MHTHASLVISLLLATTAAAQTARASGNFDTEMQKLADEWRQAFNAKDVDKLASTFTRDGELLVPRGDLRGRAAIRDEYRGNDGDTLSALVITRAVRSGTFGYITGTYAGTGPKPGGGTQSGTGHFISVLKRVGNKWLIAATASVPDIQK